MTIPVMELQSLVGFWESRVEWMRDVHQKSTKGKKLRQKDWLHLGKIEQLDICIKDGKEILSRYMREQRSPQKET